MTMISLRIDDETLALIDELCARRGNTRTQLVLHSLDRVLAGHGLLEPAAVGERRRAREVPSTQ
jgi:Ribbon-helix-helix protein, copG family